MSDWVFSVLLFWAVMALLVFDIVRSAPIKQAIPKCYCGRRMKVVGLLPDDSQGPQRVFQVWVCPTMEHAGQAVTEAGTVQPDEWERMRNQ
jgi:hypothetical protein